MSPERNHLGQATGGRRNAADLPRAGLAQSVAAWLLAAVAVVTPWWFGGVEATVQRAVCAVLALCALAWWLDILFVPGRLVRLPVALVPLLFAVLLGIAQLVPLPREWVARLSPTAFALRSDAEAVVSHLGGASRAWIPLSLDPAATQHDAAMLVAATVAFLVASAVFVRIGSARALWTALAVNGAFLSVFGIVQQVTFNGKLYWTVRPAYGSTTPFGPYVNHNNAAGYLLICLAAPLAVWLSANSGPDGAIGAKRRLADGPSWPSFVALVCLLAGVVCSLSRGAWVALVVASGVTGIVAWKTASERPRLLPRLGIVAVVVSAVILGLGLWEPIQQRFSPWLRDRPLEDARLEHWSRVWPAVPTFAWTGSGLGTYRHAYRLFDRRPDQEWFYHAENQYLEAAVEAGIAGPVLLLATIVLVLVAGFRLLRQPPTRPFGLTAVFAVIAQAVHALFDFGPYLAANLFALAVVSGATVGLAAALDRQPGSLQRDRFGRWIAFVPIRSGRLSLVAVAAVFLQMLFPLQQLHTQVQLDHSRRELLRLTGDRTTSPEDLEAALYRASRTLELRPADVPLRQTVARGWIELFRRRALSAFLDDQSPAVDEKLWRSSDPLTLAVAAITYARQQRTDALNALRNDPVVAETLPAAFQHFLAVQQACPLKAEAHIRLAELAFLVDDPRNVAVFTRPLERFGDDRPEILFRAGLLTFEAGRTDASLAFWRRSLAGSDRFETAILDRAEGIVDWETLLARVLPDSPERLVHLAQTRLSDPSQAAVRRLVLQRVRRLLDARPLAPARRAELERALRHLDSPVGEIPARRSPVAGPSAARHPFVGNSRWCEHRLRRHRSPCPTTHGAKRDGVWADFHGRHRDRPEVEAAAVVLQHAGACWNRRRSDCRTVPPHDNTVVPPDDNIVGDWRRGWGSAGLEIPATPG